MIYQKFPCIKVELVITASEWPYTKKCSRQSLSSPCSKSLGYWQLTLTVAVIGQSVKIVSNSWKFFWARVLPPNFPSLLSLRTSLITGVQKSFDTWCPQCSSWPRMYMLHEVFWLAYLPHHLDNTCTLKLTQVAILSL